MFCIQDTIPPSCNYNARPDVAAYIAYNMVFGYFKAPYAQVLLSKSLYSVDSRQKKAQLKSTSLLLYLLMDFVRKTPETSNLFLLVCTKETEYSNSFYQHPQSQKYRAM